MHNDIEYLWTEYEDSAKELPDTPNAHHAFYGGVASVLLLLVDRLSATEEGEVFRLDMFIQACLLECAAYNLKLSIEDVDEEQLTQLLDPTTDFGDLH